MRIWPYLTQIHTEKRVTPKGSLTFSRNYKCICSWTLIDVCFSGLFKIVPEKMPYSTIEEMLSLRPVGLDSCLPFTFSSYSKMTFGSFTLEAGRALTVLSIERHEGKEDQVRCKVRGQQEASAEVRVPLSFQGEFYECQSEECFTLQEIMASSCLRSRRFHFANNAKSENLFVFSPIYEVQGIMNCETLSFFFFYLFF